MFKEFASVFKDQDGKLHLYVFPGLDEDGKQIYRNIDLSSIAADYTYVKNKDRSYEFIFTKNVKTIACNMVHCKTGEIKKFSFENL